MSAPTGWLNAPNLTMTEAAAVIREQTGQPCSRSLVYEWANSERIPIYRNARHRIRVRTADLVRFMATMPKVTEAAQDTLFSLSGDGSP